MPPSHTGRFLKPMLAGAAAAKPALAKKKATAKKKPAAKKSTKKLKVAKA